MAMQLRYSQNAKRGAALVEFSMVLPIIMLLFYGMIELIRVLLLQHSVDTAAYEGARCAIVPGAKSVEATECAKQLLSAGHLKSATIKVEPEIITEDTALITVRVELPIKENAWLTPFWFKRGSVVSQVSLLTERPAVVQLSGLPELLQKTNTLTSSLGL